MQQPKFFTKERLLFAIVLMVVVNVLAYLASKF